MPYVSPFQVQVILPTLAGIGKVFYKEIRWSLIFRPTGFDVIE